MTDDLHVATSKYSVKFTAHFEQNLADIEAFLLAGQAPQAFDALIEELSDTVIPNLERFSAMGRLFLNRPIRSVEVANSVARLMQQLQLLGRGAEIREYVLVDYLVLYVRVETSVYLLGIRHQRQLSFDLKALWVSSL